MFFWAHCLVGAILKDFYKPNLHAKSINYGDFIQTYQRSLRLVMIHEKKTFVSPEVGRIHSFKVIIMNI